MNNKHHNSENAMEKAEEFLTEPELAERWRITVRKLQKDRLQGGSVAFLKLGGAIRYRLADVLAYEAAHQYQSTSEYRS